MLNIKLNNLSNVIALPYAACSSKRKTMLHRSLVSSYHSIVEIPDRHVEDVMVQCITIDDIIDGLDLKRVNWIKIDVEGAEVDVLKGAERALSMTHNMIIEVRPKNVISVLPTLKGKGFAIRKLGRGYFYAYRKEL